MTLQSQCEGDARQEGMRRDMHPTRIFFQEIVISCVALCPWITHCNRNREMSVVVP